MNLICHSNMKLAALSKVGCGVVDVLGRGLVVVGKAPQCGARDLVVTVLTQLHQLVNIPTNHTGIAHRWGDLLSQHHLHRARVPTSKVLEWAPVGILGSDLLSDNPPAARARVIRALPFHPIMVTKPVTVVLIKLFPGVLGRERGPPPFQGLIKRQPDAFEEKVELAAAPKTSMVFSQNVLIEARHAHWEVLLGEGWEILRGDWPSPHDLPRTSPSLIPIVTELDLADSGREEGMLAKARSDVLREAGQLVF